VLVHPVLRLTTQQLYSIIAPPITTPIACPKRKIVLQRKLLDVGTKTYIMAILSITPDIFSDGGQYLKLEDALARADELIYQGADIIDVGGQSTRPGAVKISYEEESGRVIPVLKALRQRHPNINLSVDTFYSTVANEAIQAGADMINDVTGGLHDPAIFEVAAKWKVPIVVIHSTPTQQYEIQRDGGEDPPKSDIVAEVISYLRGQTAVAVKAGVNQWQIILDPGLGFSKTYEQSIELIRRANELTVLGYPVLIGPSRKGFVGHMVAEVDAKAPARMWGTMACCCAAVAAGVCIVRVHDVKECRAVLQVADTIFRQPVHR